MNTIPKLWIRPADSNHLDEILALWQNDPSYPSCTLQQIENAFWGHSLNHGFLVAVDLNGQVKGWAALLPIIPPDGASQFEARLVVFNHPNTEACLRARLLKSACAFAISTDLRAIYCGASFFKGEEKETALNLGWEALGEISPNHQEDLWAFRVPKVSEGPVQLGHTRLFTSRNS
ncbi:MAG: hypothetical protein H6581_22475 [Bacteroidia bacterium]|nr:hypothetical protein [Bacteroidia bacterium]